MNHPATRTLSETSATHRRRAGILVPLASLPSSDSWGIGEIAGIPAVGHWLRAAGHRVLQLLPINEMPPAESSPYSALSAMAIDPQFITLSRLEDFAANGGEPALAADLRRRLDAVRVAPTIQYPEVRDLKQTVLRRAFAHFQHREWNTGTRRAAALRAFIEDQAWWLRDYALFRAIHAAHSERAWTDWPEPLRNRQPEALAAAHDALADDVLFRQYLQWVAGDQWADARDTAADVAIFGDLPFMVSGDSADVWVRQDQFRLDASVGVPPDAFSATGQDWGLPVYRWDVMEAGDFEWLRHRARRNADLFDGYRVDHLVGFYRTFFRPHDGSEAQFTPAAEDAQLAVGERVLDVFRSGGAEIIAEDLGTVPDFVRESLTRLSVPGYKVFRWERAWNAPDQPFKDPRDYPACAVATSGTHDTEPMVIWWEAAAAGERAAILAIPSIAEQLSDDRLGAAVTEPRLPHDVHEALLAALYGSGADLLLLPIQDVFGWRDRINQPATVGDSNWTWRLPWPADRLGAEPVALVVANQLAEWCRKYDR